MNALEFPQIGTGWAFPPTWTPDPGGVVVSVNGGEPHVQEAMRLLLRTGIGSRVMRPTLGAGVDRYVFEARTDEVCYRLANDVRRTLSIWEPRVVIDSVTATPAGTAEDRIDISIDYTIDRHRRPGNLVLPFYVQDTP